MTTQYELHLFKQLRAKLEKKSSDEFILKGQFLSDVHPNTEVIFKDYTSAINFIIKQVYKENFND